MMPDWHSQAMPAQVVQPIQAISNHPLLYIQRSAA